MEEDELPEGAHGLLSVAQHMVELTAQDLFTEVACRLRDVRPAQDGTADQHGIELIILASYVVSRILVSLRRTLCEVDASAKHHACALAGKVDRERGTQDCHSRGGVGAVQEIGLVGRIDSKAPGVALLSATT